MDEGLSLSNLIDMVAARTGHDKKDVNAIIKGLIKEMSEELKSTALVRIGGFGEFSLEHLKDFDHHVFKEGGIRRGGRREVATNRKAIRFRLEWALRQKLIEHLALGKTFGDLDKK